MQPININTTIQDPILNSKYIDLGSIFDKVYNFFYNLFDPSYSIPYLGTGFKIVLAVLSIFFIFVITYTFVRLLEIRKKEHEHLHHEIEEYAHKHAEME
jgi:hypothetical protein